MFTLEIEFKAILTGYWWGAAFVVISKRFINFGMQLHMLRKSVLVIERHVAKWTVERAQVVCFHWHRRRLVFDGRA